MKGQILYRFRKLKSWTISIDALAILVAILNVSCSLNKAPDSRIRIKSHGQTSGSVTKSLSFDYKFVGCDNGASDFEHLLPLVELRCAGCHGTDGSGQAYLDLGNGKSEAKRALLETRLDKIDVNQSLLNQKITLTTVHGPNTKPVLAGDEQKFFQSWAKNATECKFLTSATNNGRSSSSALFTQLSYLFPSATSVLTPTQFNNATSTGLNLAITNPLRPLTAITVVAYRPIVGALCDSYRSSSDTKLFSETAATLPGETLPKSISLRKALVGLRNSTGLPFAATDAEVLALEQVYTAVAASMPSNNSGAERALCTAILLSPQFLIGAPRSSDPLRTLLLELAGRTPTPAETYAFEKLPPAKRPNFMRTTLGAIMDDPVSRAQALKAINEWHRDWLGLRSFIPSTGWHAMRTSGMIQSANLLSGVPVTEIPKGSADTSVNDGTGLDGVTVRPYFGSPYAWEYSEQCANGVTQDFDPSTSRLQWEQWNHLYKRFEKIGAWVKVNGTWTTEPGSITLADGSTLAVDLSDIVFARKGDPGNKTLTYIPADGYVKPDSGGVYRELEVAGYYISGRLVGTPVDGFIRTSNNAGQVVNHATIGRRVRRFNAAGIEQNGYSKIRLPLSGQSANVCNIMSRFMVTCNLMPNPKLILKIDYWAGAGFTPMLPSLYYNSGMFQDYYFDQLFHPEAIDSLRCGVTDQSEIAKTGQPGYNQDKAYPRGSATNPADPLNDIAFNMSDNVPAKGLPSSGTPLAEVAAWERFKNDISEEPYRLLERVLLNEKDYRKFLTADYTVVGPELEWFYRVQGQSLPYYPADFSWPSGRAVNTSPKTIPADLRVLPQSNLKP